MKNKDLAISEIFSLAWQKVTSNIWFYVVFTVFILFLTEMANQYQRVQNGNAIAFWFLGFLVSLLSQYCSTKIGLASLIKEKVGWDDIFDNMTLFFRFSSGVILYGFVVLIGLLLFIVPGVIWAIKFQFVTFLILDKNLSVKEAFIESSQITSGLMWQIFLFNLLAVGVILLGALALGVGILIAAPVIWVADGLLYKTLLEYSKIKE